MSDDDGGSRVHIEWLDDYATTIESDDYRIEDGQLIVVEHVDDGSFIRRFPLANIREWSTQLDGGL